VQIPVEPRPARAPLHLQAALPVPLARPPQHQARRGHDEEQRAADPVRVATLHAQRELVMQRLRKLHNGMPPFEHFTAGDAIRKRVHIDDLSFAVEPQTDGSDAAIGRAHVNVCQRGVRIGMQRNRDHLIPGRRPLHRRMRQLGRVIQQVRLKDQQAAAQADCDQVSAQQYADPQMHLKERLAPPDSLRLIKKSHPVSGYTQCFSDEMAKA